MNCFYTFSLLFSNYSSRHNKEPPEADLGGGGGGGGMYGMHTLSPAIFNNVFDENNFSIISNLFDLNNKQSYRSDGRVV